MKTDLILKFKQNVFSKVIWSCTFKGSKIKVHKQSYNNQQKNGEIRSKETAVLRLPINKNTFSPTLYVFLT